MGSPANSKITGCKARFDYIILKSTDMFLLIRFVISLYSREWVHGLVYLVAILSISFIGASIHKDISWDALANPDINNAIKGGCSVDDFRSIMTASFHLCMLLGFTIFFVLPSEFGWLIRVVAFLATWLLGGLYIAFLFAIIEKQYFRGRLRSIGAGVILYAIGMCLPLLAVIGLVNVLAAGKHAPDVKDIPESVSVFEVQPFRALAGSAGGTRWSCYPPPKHRHNEPKPRSGWVWAGFRKR